MAGGWPWVAPMGTVTSIMEGGYNIRTTLRFEIKARSKLVQSRLAQDIDSYTTAVRNTANQSRLAQGARTRRPGIGSTLLTPHSDCTHEG